MRLFIACLIIYANNLHWSLYVVAFCIVGAQFVHRFIKEMKAETSDLPGRFFIKARV